MVFYRFRYRIYLTREKTLDFSLPKVFRLNARLKFLKLEVLFRQSRRILDKQIWILFPCLNKKDKFRLTHLEKGAILFLSILRIFDPLEY